MKPSKSVTYPALRACPYCGATPDARVVHTDQGDGQMEDCTMVVCDFRIGGCGASGPNRMDPAEAIAGWNRRAEYWKDELTAANAEIERLREKLSGETRESGWLVERRDRPGPTYAFFDESGIFGWTADVNEALRLARREDADRIGGALVEDVVCVEHVWCTPTTGEQK